ncbi:killer cell lectin-like receptor subfamily B member 1A [Aquarana catesbeiana]|uniref:killer cell lectin-like receptor subfamily B member 1A n=1 Tax=Aquarana catesbeiana TaxID=8400 RepID=UPI003CCA5BED
MERNNTNSDSSHLCPPDWIYIYKKCYSFSEKKMTYLEMNSATFGCRLASIPETLISLRRLIAITRQDFWVGMDRHSSNDTWMAKWRDGSMEKVLKGDGSCIKLGRDLKYENCYSKLLWICERDAKETTKDALL